MKKIYLAFAAFAAFALTSCSAVQYSHDAEDDVYFSSRTVEDIDVVYAPSERSDDNAYSPNTRPGTPVIVNQPTNRQTRNRRVRSNDPAYCPPGGTTNRTPRTSTPRTNRQSTPRTSTPRSPSPTSTNRPSRPSRGLPN